MNILVTGGAGFIGSHTVVELLDNNDSVVVVDNFSNSNPESINRIEAISSKRVPHHIIDLCDKAKLEEIFKQYSFDAIIHFAGLKSVGESIKNPLAYYKNNIESTLNLLEMASQYKVHRFVFSSSATVYGTPEHLPIQEHNQTGLGITNPYGQTKYINELLLKDFSLANPIFDIKILRYFNPIGAHESGLIGEDPNGVPNNIFPYITQVAVGKLEKLSIFGNDYDTQDGTGVRDYIHVVDLAKGHLAALNNTIPGIHIYNLGSGKGTSVLELVNAFEKASGKTVPYEIVSRRPGDIGECYASATKAYKDLGWRAEKTIEDACIDAWHWQQQNPDGFN